jgi:hypothetical protein
MRQNQVSFFDLLLERAGLCGCSAERKMGVLTRGVLRIDSKA